MRFKKLLTIMALLLSTTQLQAETTVITVNGVNNVPETLQDPNDLWVKPAALPDVNGFELKPEGACLDDICVPVKQDRDSEIYLTRGDANWFNVTELARRLDQSYVHDHEDAVWSFGPVPATRNRFVNDHVAPDFILADQQGNPVTLSAHKNKKVLLLTWASW